MSAKLRPLSGLCTMPGCDNPSLDGLRCAGCIVSASPALTHELRPPPTINGVRIAKTIGRMEGLEWSAAGWNHDDPTAQRFRDMCDQLWIEIFGEDT